MLDTVLRSLSYILKVMAQVSISLMRGAHFKIKIVVSLHSFTIFSRTHLLHISRAVSVVKST